MGDNLLSILSNLEIHSVSNRAELDALTRQKKFELEEFKTLHQEFQEQETPSAIYCLSSSWFKVWEGFVTGRKREVGVLHSITNYLIKFDGRLFSIF